MLHPIYSEHLLQNQSSMSRQSFISEWRCISLFMYLKAWIRSLCDDRQHLFMRCRSTHTISTVHFILKICSYTLWLHLHSTEQQSVRIPVGSSGHAGYGLTVFWQSGQSHSSLAFSCTVFETSSAAQGLSVLLPRNSQSRCLSGTHFASLLCQSSVLFPHCCPYQG